MSAIRTRSVAVAVVLVAIGAWFAATSAASTPTAPRATASPATSNAGPQPQLHLTARRLLPRHGALARGTLVRSSALFTNRVLANAQIGFAAATVGSADYPVRTKDGGRSWRIDGPQVHIDAADGPEAVGYVGVVGPHTFFTYGSQVIDVTSDGGQHWWQTFPDGLVSAVVSNPRGDLVAYVQQSVGNAPMSPAVTWQYVSSDGGRNWSFSTAMGG